jgi:hypothetical protein
MQPSTTPNAMQTCAGSLRMEEMLCYEFLYQYNGGSRFGQGIRLQESARTNLMAKVPFHPRGGFNSSDETTRCCGQSERLITVCSKGLRHLLT